MWVLILLLSNSVSLRRDKMLLYSRATTIIFWLYVLILINSLIIFSIETFLINLCGLIYIFSFKIYATLCAISTYVTTFLALIAVVHIYHYSIYIIKQFINFMYSVGKKIDWKNIYSFIKRRIKLLIIFSLIILNLILLKIFFNIDLLQEFRIIWFSFFVIIPLIISVYNDRDKPIDLILIYFTLKVFLLMCVLWLSNYVYIKSLNLLINNIDPLSIYIIFFLSHLLENYSLNMDPGWPGGSGGGWWGPGGPSGGGSGGPGGPSGGGPGPLVDPNLLVPRDSEPKIHDNSYVMHHIYQRHKILQPNPIYHFVHNLPPLTYSEQAAGLLNYINKASPFVIEKFSTYTVRFEDMGILNDNLIFLEKLIRNYPESSAFKNIEAGTPISNIRVNHEICTMLIRAAGIKMSTPNIVSNLVLDHYNVKQPDLIPMTPAERAVGLLNYIDKANFFLKGLNQFNRLDLNSANQSFILQVIRENPESNANKYLEKNSSYSQLKITREVRNMLIKTGGFKANQSNV